MTQKPQIPPEHLENFRMWREIEEESDRAAAIIAFAFLDDQLTEVIKAHLHTRKRTTKELFVGLGPLMSFAARSKLAYSLGFFGPRTLNDLTILADVRNRFAHQKKYWKFTSPEISKKCFQINITKHIKKFGANRYPTDPRYIYLRTISMIAMFLRSELTHNRPPPPRKPHFLTW